jgi:hypothetical protein
MLQTYEATLEPSGQIWFTDLSQPVVKQSQKVLITMVSPLFNGVSTQEGKPSIDSPKTDWRDFSGVLKGSAPFIGDPQAIQIQLRSDWP